MFYLSLIVQSWFKAHDYIAKGSNHALEVKPQVSSSRI